MREREDLRMGEKKIRERERDRQTERLRQEMSEE
jgi:hypothetical protein